VTSDGLFDLETLPDRVAVIGLGAIGIEIAQALARLGVEVAAYDAGTRLAGLSDPAVTEALRACLAEELTLRPGVEVELAAAPGGIEVRAGGERRVVDLVVAAVGRRPNVEDLGFETLGLALDDRGMPPVDPATLRIEGHPVFLAGDVAGRTGLLHEAADDGHVAALNALGAAPGPLGRRTPLAIVFCDPNVAVVGARASALDPQATRIGEASFARQGRARTAQRNHGLLRVFADRDGRLLGAELAAPAGEHMAHLLALAIGRGLSVHDMLRMPFYHPTLEEGLRSALRAIARELPPCAPSDLAGCPPLGVEALE
jgi:dihydrolipoamide dehydrogenase